MTRAALVLCLLSLIAGLAIGRHDCNGEALIAAFLVLFLMGAALIVSRR